MAKWFFLALVVTNVAWSMDLRNQARSPHPWEHLANQRTLSPKSSPKPERILPGPQVEQVSGLSPEFQQASVAYLAIWLAHKTATENIMAKEADPNDIKCRYRQEILTPAKTLAQLATQDSFEYITDAIESRMLPVNFYFGSTFLHAAVQAGRADVVQFLLKHGANQYIVDAYGFFAEAYNGFYCDCPTCPEIKELFSNYRQAMSRGTCYNSDLESVASSH